MDNGVKKRKLKLSGCIGLLGILILIVGIVYIVVGLPEKASKTITHYTYNINKSTSYTTTLKPESIYYYDELFKNAGTYPSASIEKFNLFLNYEYIGDTAANINYQYNIVADIVGEYKSDDSTDNNIWEKKYTLLETKTANVTSTSFKISEPVEILYSNYNNLVAAFKDTYKLSVNSYLRVKLNVSYNATIIDSDKKINQSDTIELRIPLNDTVTKVIDNNQKTEQNSISDTLDEEPDYILLGIGLIFIILAIVLFIIANNKKVVTKHSLYKKNIERILKEYGDIIVTVRNKPNVKHLRVMALATIDDLVDVAEQNKCHIIRYEIIKKSESFLLVIHNGYVYVYIVNDEEINYNK